MFILLKVAVCEDNGVVLNESIQKFVAVSEPVSDAPATPRAPAQTDFRNQIIGSFMKFGRQTANDTRRRIHPERHSESTFGFQRVFRALVSEGVLEKCGETQRADIYRLVAN
jgi:hypothetical protein